MTGARALPWIFLAAAILTEICSTLGLRSMAASRHWTTVVLVTLGYAVSFGCLAVALQHLKVGVVYAIWSAVGTAAVALAGARLFGDRLGLRAGIGIALIVGGVVLLSTSGARQDDRAGSAGGAAASDLTGRTG